MKHSGTRRSKFHPLIAALVLAGGTQSCSIHPVYRKPDTGSRGSDRWSISSIKLQSKITMPSMIIFNAELVRRLRTNYFPQAPLYSLTYTLRPISRTALKSLVDGTSELRRIGLRFNGTIRHERTGNYAFKLTETSETTILSSSLPHLDAENSDQHTAIIARSLADQVERSLALKLSLYQPTPMNP